MATSLTNAQLWQAINVYLRHAYADAPVPASVKARLDVVRSSCGDATKTSAFERVASSADQRACLRLGNRYFPHMKFVVESRNGSTFLRADAHDAHCRPPAESREMMEYQQLVSRNRDISTAIETEWAELELPTFKTFLREDLARRTRAAK